MGGPRLLVAAPLNETVIGILAAAVAGVPVGDPFDPATVVGPKAGERHLAKFEHYVAQARADGGRVVVGGERLDLDGGSYYLPTVIADLPNSSRAVQGEICPTPRSAGSRSPVSAVSTDPKHSRPTRGPSPLSSPSPDRTDQEPRMSSTSASLTLTHGTTLCALVTVAADEVSRTSAPPPWGLAATGLGDWGIDVSPTVEEVLGQVVGT